MGKKTKNKFINEQGFLCFTREDLLELENIRLKASEQDLISKALFAKADKDELNAVLSVRALKRDAATAQDKRNRFLDEQKKLLSKLGNKYGVDFKKAFYDDETGVITVIEEKEKVARKQDNDKTVIATGE